MKAGDLVQVLPAKIGLYIVLDRTYTRLGSTCWDLKSAGPIHAESTIVVDEKFIEVVCESR